MNTTDSNEHSSPLQFPCDFMIKIMGKTSDQFENNILTIVKKHYPNLDPTKISKRTSKDNTYTALTITVEAQNQAELDALYQEISQSDDVIMAL